MKKIVLICLFMAMAGISAAQVDTFDLKNMPKYLFLGDQWADYSKFYEPLPAGIHPDGTHCSYPELHYDPVLLTMQGGNGSCLLGIQMLLDIGLNDGVYPANYRHICNFAAGKHSDSTIQIAGLALMLPHYFMSQSGFATIIVRERLMENGFDAISLQLMDTSMNVITEGYTLLADSVGKPIFCFNKYTFEVWEDPVGAASTTGPGAGWYYIFYDIHEVYFDSSISVTDSFYLGARLRRTIQGEPYVGVAVPSIIEDHTLTSPTSEWFTPQYNWKAQGGDHIASYYDAMTPIIESLDDSIWFTVNSGMDDHGYMLIFPILEPDCGLRGAINWNPLGGGNVRLRWASGSNDTLWEVSYGPAGIAPEDGTIVSTTSPSIVLSGIAPDSLYVAFVRAQCMRYRDTMWSDWSDSIPIFISTQEIASVNKDDGIALQPNPASNSVLLTAEAPLSGIDVHTASGAFYKHLPASGLTADIDVSSWPAGTYLLRISTPTGVTTKKLLIL